MSQEKQEKIISPCVPLPLCVINNQGKIIDANQHIGDVFIYDAIIDADIFTLTGIKTADLYAAAAEDTHPQLRRNEKVFRLVTYLMGEEPDSNLGIIFNDVTNMEELKERYNNEKPCVAKIQVDNYDQLIDTSGAAPNLGLSSEIDKIIRKWAARINGSVSRVKSSNYVVWFEQQYLDRLVASKFDLLDDVRNLETGADFPASLSIGIGVGGKSMTQTEEYANAALDLALGRGGDQAVVKRNIKIEYYGGKLQTVEKSNKGKSRIVGHALKQLIDQSRRIFVMGHRYPDMDSFGASLGIMRLCTLSEKEPFIVIDEFNDSLQAIFRQAKESENYRFISSEKAAAMAEAEDLLIVVDTHRPSMVQCPELLGICERVVVIDHHRKVEEFIENPVLAYMESYASSTSELVAEILQYMTTKKVLLKLEAEALLAGITVDTNGFAMKTGVRTFEAAAWLRRQGADPTEVKRFFQEDLYNIRLKAAAISATEIIGGDIAVTTCQQVMPDAQLICAQVADQLLTIKGVRASFVVGRNNEMKTVISARSMGEINVQVIMEKFGGGGHLTTAAAQVDTSIDETVSKIMNVLEANKQ
ncbi:MAG: DHH family phosphoesterase [Anaerovoracaceae bacterium]